MSRSEKLRSGHYACSDTAINVRNQLY
jgi:hypothetical protein